MSILDNFVLPEVAAEAFAAQGLQSVQLADGVNRLMSGHDKGVAFRFHVHSEYNPVKSKLSGYECFNEFDMVEWIVDKNNRPVEQVRFLPPTLLSFDKDGDCVGGRYREEYLRFKEGRSAPGTPLTRWGVLPEGEVAALAKNGIFTVEQFSATPRAKIQSTYSPTVVEALDRAGQYVNSKSQIEAQSGQIKQLQELQELNEKLQERLAALEAKSSESQKEDKLDAVKQKLAEAKKGNV